MFRLENVVVNDVLNIKQLALDGSVISIEGQSGSGKSTLLRLLNNLDTQTSGEIFYRDKPLIDIHPMELRKQVVMVPQAPVMFDGTIRDNLMIGLRLSNAKEATEDQLKQMLDLFWLDKELETKASDLSGGEQQRLALGRVLLMKGAKVFLLDEPSSDLDDATTAHVIESFITQATKQDQQIIMVTHNKEITERFTDQKINLDEYSMQIRRGES